MTMTMTRTKSITPAAATSSSLSASTRRRRRRKCYTESAAVSLCWVFAMMMVLGVSVLSDRHNNNGNTAGVVHALKIRPYGRRSTVTTATRSPASTAIPVAVLAIRGGGNSNSPAAVRADRPDPAAPTKTAAPTPVSDVAATTVATATRGGGRGGDRSPGHTRLTTTTTTTILTLLAQHPLVQGIVGLLGGYVSYRFAIWLPLVVTPQAATGTYIPARYQYETTGVDHKFCASPITYLTDYMVLAALCVVGKRLQQPHSTRSSTTKTKNNTKSNSKNNTIAAHGYQEAVRIRAVGILLTYGIQFLYGGTAHAVLIPLRDRRSFRIVWSLVVSAVCVSGGVIGSLATTLLTGPPGAHNTQQPRFLPQTAFWIGYSVFLTGYTILGNLSYQRPAVDTVVAGTSQTLPTFYLMGVMIHYWKQTQTHHRTHNTRQKTMMPRMTVTTGLLWSVILGFGLNGVLLPTYALVVQYMPTITVPMLNAFLHSWLCLCYIAQGLVLYKVVELSSSAQ